MGFEPARISLRVETYNELGRYTEWVKAYDTLANADRQAIRTGVRQLSRAPLFSLVLLPVADDMVAAESATITSVQDQLYPFWELWLPGQASSADSRLRNVVAGTGADPDFSDWFNSVLEISEGSFLLPLLPDTMLAASALYELAEAMAGHPDADMLYTDEDRLSESGDRCMPRFKTGWDPDLALGRDAVGLLVAYRKQTLERCGGMRAVRRSVGLSLYELSLRVAFATPASLIRHVPAVLCHRKSLPEWDAPGARSIVGAFLAAEDVMASVVPAELEPGWNRVVRDIPDPPPLVSVIIPTRDRADLLECIADGVLSRTDYPTLELLIVDNNSQEPAAVDLLGRLAKDSRVRVLSYPGSFNFSAQNNRAAREARGEVLLLLNNDTDVIGAGWLKEMVSHAMRPEVGAVGAKLLYPDGRLQHGGMVLGPGVWPAHQLRFADRQDPGPDGELALTRTVSAVTGACMALRRSVFFEVGGLNEELCVVFNDVDLCLRLGDHGYRIVWTPFAELVHIEAASRGDDGAAPETLARATHEAKHFARFWNSLLTADPFHNPNVQYDWDTAVLADPPRSKRPWLT